MSIYGDLVTDEMTAASGKVVRSAFRSNGAQIERSERNLLKNWLVR